MRIKFPLVSYPIWVKLVLLLICIGFAFFEVNKRNADVFFLGMIISIGLVSTENSIRKAIKKSSEKR